MSSKKSSGGCLKRLFYLIALIALIGYIGDKIDSENAEDDYRPQDYTDAVYTTAGGVDYPSITTTRPQVTSAPETLSPELQNLPSDIRSHVFLMAKGGGYCEKFTGKAEINVIFVTDNVSKWSSNSENSAKTEIESEIARISAAAKNAGVSLTLSVRYHRADLSGQNISGAEFEGEWRNSATNAAGLGEYSTVQKQLESSRGVSSAPIVFLFNQSGRAFANNSYGKGVGAESVLLFSDGIYALFHEICHVYGAKDFYYPSEVEKLAEKYLSGSIMINSRDGAVDPLTAFIIGWTDTLSSSAESFLRDTSYLTSDYLKSEHEKETITGYGTREYGGGTYTGNMVKGWPHGQGTKKNSNGSYYSGIWNNGNFIQGECVIYYTDGGMYKGSYANGKINGYGELTYSDGDVYKGNWKDGKRHGYGEVIYSNGVVYKGNFADGSLCGQGTMYYADGGVYQGNWRDGKRNGYGEMKYSNGVVYKGNFADGSVNGQGTMYYTDGDVYQGNWKDGKRHGYGVYTWASGSVRTGNWSNGEYVG